MIELSFSYIYLFFFSEISNMLHQKSGARLGWLQPEAASGIQSDGLNNLAADCGSEE